jgi:hypothetical protein
MITLQQLLALADRVRKNAEETEEADALMLATYMKDVLRKPNSKVATAFYASMHGGARKSAESFE